MRALSTKTRIKGIGMIFLLSALTITAGQNEQIPQAEISNGLIKARLYLPDIDRGYYRGTRFDWSGVIARLEYAGHDYFGQWFKKYSPTNHDAVMGPVEDFIPVGYNAARPGDAFLKIGVGMLLKPDTNEYKLARSYQIINNGKWVVKSEADQVQFSHTLKDKNYSYEYTKTVQLVKDKPILVLTHTLKNKGLKSIETLVYNHNFFVIDNQPVGPGFTAEFPFNLSGVLSNGADIAEIVGHRLILKGNLPEGKCIFCGDLQGFGKSEKDYEIKVENHIAGAGVKITCNRPLAKIVFWSYSTAFCPEPYILVKAEPGEEFTWKISYEFYNCKITNGLK